MMVFERFEVQTFIDILAKLGGLLKWLSIIAGLLGSFIYRKFIESLAADFLKQISQRTLEKLENKEHAQIPELSLQADKIGNMN